MSDVAIAKNLRAAGFTQEQAEVLAESISNGITDGAATKLDIAELKTEIAKIESKLNAMFSVQILILGILLALFIKPLL